MREWDGPDLAHTFNAGESQAAGNTTNSSAAEYAFSAPGSAPVDPIPPNDKQDEVDLEVGPVVDYTNVVGEALCRLETGFEAWVQAGSDGSGWTRI